VTWQDTLLPHVIWASVAAPAEPPRPYCKVKEPVDTLLIAGGMNLWSARYQSSEFPRGRLCGSYLSIQTKERVILKGLKESR
jgi:hypothetical protein